MPEDAACAAYVYSFILSSLRSITCAAANRKHACGLYPHRLSVNSILFKYTPSADESRGPPRAELSVADLALRGGCVDNGPVLADDDDMTGNYDDV